MLRLMMFYLAPGLQDYKPLHYDRGSDAEGVPQLTVGASFGCTRELTLMHVKSGVTMFLGKNSVPESVDQTVQ